MLHLYIKKVEGVYKTIDMEKIKNKRQIVSCYDFNKTKLITDDIVSSTHFVALEERLKFYQNENFKFFISLL